MKNSLSICLALALTALAARSAPPSFRDTSAPEGWTNLTGQADGDNVLQAKGAASLVLQTTAPVPLPVEATFRFRAAVGDTLSFEVTGPGTNPVPRLLRMGFTLGGPNSASVTAYGSEGRPLAGHIGNGTRSVNGHFAYNWRFPTVKTCGMNRIARRSARRMPS